MTEDETPGNRPRAGCCIVLAIALAGIVGALWLVAHDMIGRVAVLQRTMGTPSILGMPDARTLAWTDTMGRVNVSGQWGYTAQNRLGAATTDAFSQNGTFLAGAFGAKITVTKLNPAMYQIDTSAELDVKKTQNTTALAVSEDGQTLLEGRPDAVVVWSLPTRRRTAIVKEIPNAKVLSLARSKKVAVAVLAKEVVLWDVSAGKVLKRVEEPDVANAIALPDDESFVTTGPGVVKRWDVTRESLVLFSAPGGATAVIATSFDGSLVAVGLADRVLVFSAATGATRYDARLGTSHTIASLVFAPDGRNLYAGTTQSELVRTGYRGDGR